MNENNFFSLDRLIEFGLGLTVARQMIEVMNQSMKQMYIPGSMQSMNAPQTNPIYVIIGGKAAGPMAESEFSRLAAEKAITKDTLAWIPGNPDWKPIERIPTLLKIIALTPPPVPQL